MSYKIIIIKKETVKKPGRPEWVVVDSKPLDNDDISELGRRKSIYGKDMVDIPAMKDVMGYAPAIEVEQETDTEIYAQTVDQLDLAKVVKAINNI